MANEYYSLMVVEIYYLCQSFYIELVNLAILHILVLIFDANPHSTDFPDNNVAFLQECVKKMKVHEGSPAEAMP